MKLEDQIKESLTKHAEDVRPGGTSWDGVQAKVRRGHYARVAMVSTLTVALIAAVVVVVPRLGSSKPQGNGFAESPTPSVSPSASPTPIDFDTSGWLTHVGTQADFSILIPPDWKGGWFEGNWDFEPKDLPGLPEGGDTFAIEVRVTSGSYTDFASADAQQLKIGGRNALRSQKSDFPRHYTYAIEWTDCVAGETDCNGSASARALIAELSASTQALWDKYHAIAPHVVETLRVYDGATPAHGTFASSTPVDAYTRALARFMDARAEGVGAEDLVCCSASNDADMYYSVGTLDLTGWTELGGRDVATSAATATYRVDVLAGEGTTTSHHTEEMTVGYQSGEQSDNETPVVLDVKLVP